MASLGIFIHYLEIIAPSVRKGFRILGDQCSAKFYMLIMEGNKLDNYRGGINSAG